PQRPILLGDARAQLAEAREQAVEHLLHGRSLDFGLRRPVSYWAQLSGDLHDHGHQTGRACGTPARNDSVGGRIVSVWNVPRTASSVFSPSPVISSTTRSSGSMSPRAASLLSTAVVTPPAVSVKMPVVWASSPMPARISASLTASTDPPEHRASSSA